MESLVKFLENERKLRHELESALKQIEMKDMEQKTSLQSFKDKAERIAEKEAELKSRIESLIDE